MQKTSKLIERKKVNININIQTNIDSQKLKEL